MIIFIGIVWKWALFSLLEVIWGGRLLEQLS